MTWFSKPRNAKAAAEKMCDRCGERRATIHLTEVMAPNAAAPGQPWRASSLCPECARAMRRNRPGDS